MHRMHAFDPSTGNYAGDAFNPCKGWHVGDAKVGGRFHPIRQIGGGSNAPSLYAAETLEIAAYESIFHSPTKVHHWDELVKAKWAKSEVVVKNDVALFDVSQPNLNHFPIDGRPDAPIQVAEVVHTFKDSYVDTREWAERFLECTPDVIGLRYFSRLATTGSAYVFYDLHGRPLGSETIASAAPPTPITDADLAEELQLIAHKGNITLFVR